MEHIAGDYNDVGRQRDDLLYGASVRHRDVSLALVDACGSLPLILPKAEMYVSEVYEAHA
jgi:hypothetical protein